MTSLNESEPESNSIDEEDLKATTPHADSMAYLAALNAVNLILLDTVSFQRNNHMLYTAGLALAMRRIADGDDQGALLLDTIQKSISFDQDYVVTSAKNCAEILVEFKKLQ